VICQEKPQRSLHQRHALFRAAVTYNRVPIAVDLGLVLGFNHEGYRQVGLELWEPWSSAGSSVWPYPLSRIGSKRIRNSVAASTAARVKSIGTYSSLAHVLNKSR